MKSEESLPLETTGKPELCIICNKEARDRMEKGGRELTEELLTTHPADIIPGISCWNCYGSGFVHDESNRLKLMRAYDSRRLDFLERLFAGCPGASISYVDPDDAEDGEGGFAIEVDSHTPLDVHGKETLRDAIDAAYAEMHSDLSDVL